MTYENGGQLDRALKKAVRDRGGDPGDGYRQALRDRFLCRVFSDPDGRFILKGGSGLLARIPDGRATRDIDFATASRKSCGGCSNAIKTASASKRCPRRLIFSSITANTSCIFNRSNVS